MTAAIELIAVTKNYGRVRAVNELSLAVPEGALYGLIGPNGAGKTTTFAMMSGFLRPTLGEIRVRGVFLSTQKPPVGQVLALPQDAALPGHKRVEEVLVFLAELSGMPKQEAKAKSRSALERVGLGDLTRRRVDQLSHGQRRRVGIAQTLVGHDEVIVLDEPTAGLDPRTALELGALIKTLAEDRTVVLSSHNLAELEALCTHAAILDKGMLVAHGTMDEIRGTGQRLFVELSSPPSDAQAVLQGIEALDAVKTAKMAANGQGIEVDCHSAEGADALTNEVLKLLIEKGVAVKGVERGKRLEQRFMEETGQGR